MEICQAVTCQIRYTLDLDKLSAFETYARTWISLIETFARAFAPEKHDPGSVIGMTMWQLKKDKPLHIVGVLDGRRRLGHLLTRCFTFTNIHAGWGEPNPVFWAVVEIQERLGSLFADGLSSYHGATPIME